jgi:hypothetical protein
MSSGNRRRRVLPILLTVLVLSVAVSASAAFASRPTQPVSGPTSSVTITVQSVTGRFVEGATVTLSCGGAKFRAKTPIDGTVTFTGVPYGTATVYVSHREFCDAYYRCDVAASAVAYTTIVHPKALWKGIGY